MTILSFANLIRDDVDFAQYLKNSEAKAMVIPAGAYVDDLTVAMQSGADCVGDALPWAKFFGKFALRSREVTAWVGYKGHAKSAVLSEIMLSLMAVGRRVLVISPEFAPVELLKRKVRQSAAASAPTERYIRQWCAWANSRLWLFDKQSKLSPDLVLGVCAYGIEELQVNHIIVDSLMKCGIGTDDYNAQKDFVDRLQHLAHKSSDTHIHLVMHARKGEDDRRAPSLHDAKGTSELTDMLENVVTVWMDKRRQIAKQSPEGADSDDPDVLVTVEAQRNFPSLGRYGLWFANGLRFVAGANHKPRPYFAPELETTR